MQKVGKIILFVGIIAIGITSLAIYWTFYRPLPDYNASVKLSRLRQPVSIKWDTYGVPHIYAKDKHDLYMALGYVHAQDRLWQMTVSQLAAQGRFAEFFGKNLIPVDRFQRTIGFWRTAQKMEQELPDSTRSILQAYADGVNQYVKMHPKDLPIQFSLAEMNPILWTPTQSLALGRLMAWQLNIAWKTELNYTLLFEKLTTDEFRELFPNPYISSSLPVKAPSDSNLSAEIVPLLQNTKKYQRLMHMQGKHTGSNAWAVDGSKSTSGKPLLAGDPHLGLHIPGTWYEVHLNLKGRNLSGATIPGAPAVVLGQNDALAWSLTNVMLDDTDFFEERVDPHDSTRYQLDSLAGKPIYRPFTYQHEVIKVKGSDNRSFTRKLTGHGPVISDIYATQKPLKNKIISMSWTGLQPGHEMEALQTMGWAQNLKTFLKGVKQFKNPAQNIIYADTVGNIGLFTAASVPIRNGNPIVLRPGWNPKMDWRGTVPFKELPQIINPKKGWVANANNPVAGPDFPYYMSVYWQPDSRYNRIKKYLSVKNRLGITAFQIMQNDTYSGYAHALTNHILPALKSSTDSSFATALKYLQNWDYTYGKGETAASILDVFMLDFTKNTLADEMGAGLYQRFITYSAQPSRIMLRIVKNDSLFFDDVRTPRIESRDDIIRKSMHQALQFLNNQFGKEPANWQWQNLHTLTLQPPLFGRAMRDSSASKTLKTIVHNVLQKGPYPVGGNGTSINNAEYLWTNPFDMIVGPSIRRIIDLSETKQSLSIMPGGESGNPLSSYYNDQTQNWLNGQYKYLIQDSARLQQYKETKLLPAR